MLLIIILFLCATAAVFLISIIKSILALVFRIKGKDTLLIFLVNFVTFIPSMWIFYIFVSKTDGEWVITPLIVLLVLASAAEALFYRRYAEKMRHPFWFSAGANLIVVVLLLSLFLLVFGI